MSQVKDKSLKRRVLAPEFKLAGRFLVVCYERLEALEKQAIALNYRDYARRFKYAIAKGTLMAVLSRQFWYVFSARARRGNAIVSQSPYWSVAEACAKEFLEKNRELIAEVELST